MRKFCFVRWFACNIISSPAIQNTNSAVLYNEITFPRPPYHTGIPNIHPENIFFIMAMHLLNSDVFVHSFTVFLFYGPANHRQYHFGFPDAVSHIRTMIKCKLILLLQTSDFSCRVLLFGLCVYFFGSQSPVLFTQRNCLNNH